MYIKQNWYDTQSSQVTSEYLLKKIYFIYQRKKSQDFVYGIWQYKLLSIQVFF